MSEKRSQRTTTSSAKDAIMGLTIHWDWHGPKSSNEAETVIEKMRQRAMDLPFEAVSEVVQFQGNDARFDRERRNDEFGWLKVQAGQIIWNKDNTSGWECPATEILRANAFQLPHFSSFSR
jgi:hypothetical protein